MVLQWMIVCFIPSCSIFLIAQSVQTVGHLDCHFEVQLFCVQVLIRMLPSYYQHVCRYENSLVTKFFGVHCVKPVGGQKVSVWIIGI